MVVSRHMPGIGLSWSHGALVVPETVDALRSAWPNKLQTQGRTQVQGSPIEIKPLLLLVCLYIWSSFCITMALLELYDLR